MSVRRVVLLLMVLAAALAGGCARPDYLAPERYAQGLVVVLDGAGGITRAPQQIREGLDDGGVNHAIEVFNWSQHNVFADQVDVQRNREVAGKLAERVTAYVADHPGRPVHLIGLSAGTGIVVFAAEQLPPGVAVDGLVLLASSLNRHYDLVEAMTHVRNEITNFSSVMDVGVLGVGVGMAGTVDRERGTAAGLVGFDPPEDADPRTLGLYEEKLVEVPWNPTYVVDLNLGDHLGAASPAFVRRHIAPIVLDAARRRGRIGHAPVDPAPPEEAATR